MTGILDGIRVLDFGRYIAGPFAACLLGDLGAEVIRIERIGGGDDRFVFPLAGDEGGANYIQFNRNKKSLTLDIASDAGRAIVRDLVASADVVVANLPPAALADLGLDYETLRAIKSSIILTTPTAFGDSGPLRDKVGFDGIAQVMSGATWMSGQPGAPVKTYVPWVDCLTASFAAAGTLAAILWQRQTGEGQHVSANLLTSSLVPAAALLAEEAVLGTGRVASGNRSQTGAPGDMAPTSDGFIYVQVVGNPLFRRFCRMIGQDELIDDPRFRDDTSRSDHGAVLSAILSDWSSALTTDAALAACEAARIPAGPVLSPAEVLDLGHLRETGAFTPMDYPGMPRPAPVLGTPFVLSAAPGTLRTPPPGIGADTDAVLAGLGLSAERIAALRDEGTV
ncbi:MAG: CaiB/BaiF CoA transferase family protein [Sagittula sp.]|uniref:CaiB/BaiF CoA transferase family protein n=1 Tax=Sagittula sp. TaxID=2038081 RepID=UPI004058CF74